MIALNIMDSHLIYEKKLVQIISKKDLKTSDIKEIKKILKNNIFWQTIIQIAQNEGVDNFLYYHMQKYSFVKDSFIINIPKTYKQLEQKFNATTAHSLKVFSILKILSDELKKNNLSACIIQGLSCIQYYRDPGLRYYVDVDILIRPQDTKKIKSFLIQQGYLAPYKKYPNLFYKDRICFDLLTHILNVDRIKSRAYVFDANLDAMWKNAEPFFPLNNKSKNYGLVRLNIYDNFVCLCVHTFKHNYSRLIWITDIYLCLQKILKDDKKNGWKKILGATLLWKQEKIVLYSLLIIENIFQIKIPKHIKEKLNIKKLSYFEKYLIWLKLKGYNSELFCLVLWLYSIKSYKKKIEFLKENLFPKEKIAKQIYFNYSKVKKPYFLFKRSLQASSMIFKDVFNAVRITIK